MLKYESGKISNVNKLVLIGILVLIAGVAMNPQTKEQVGWELPGYRYRVPITIHENSGETLTEFQVPIIVDTQTLIAEGKMLPDCNDMRFTDGSGRTLPHWIEYGCGEAQTLVWVRVPEIPAGEETTIYMYYGNETANNGENPYAVFDLFDDFDDGELNTETWEDIHTCGTVTEEGGYLTLETHTRCDWWENIADKVAIASRGTFPTKYVFEAKVAQYMFNEKTHAGIGEYKDNRNVTFWGLYLANAPLECRLEGVHNGASFRAFSASCNGITPLLLGIRHRFDGISTSAYLEGRYPQASVLGNASGIPEGKDRFLLFLKTWYYGNFQSYISFDWARVRKYSASMPTYTIGTEEIERVPTSLSLQIS